MTYIQTLALLPRALYRRCGAAAMRRASGIMLLAMWSLFVLGFESLERPTLGQCALPLATCQVLAPSASDSRLRPDLVRADARATSTTRPPAPAVVPSSLSEVRSWSRPFR